MKKIAIYGKGGIGKSTTAVNLAITIAKTGKKVLIIGCDPKQDTTRLLVPKTQASIMEKYEQLKNNKCNLDEIAFQTEDNICCIEVGGPKPGVGCAGRGIILALEFLKKNEYFNKADVVIYDILGDVVCGGFASPISKGYAEDIYIVTSGQQASLFAANNIINGMNAVGGNIQGLIYNEKGFEGEVEIVIDFAKEVNIPIVGKIHYSLRIPDYEMRKKAITEAEPEGIEALEYSQLWNQIMTQTKTGSVIGLSNDEFYSLMEKLWSTKL